MTERKTITEEQALRRLSALCSKAEHSTGEMAAKLRAWQVDEDAQQRIIDRLKSARYVDDERFCRSFVPDKIQFDKWGAARLRWHYTRKV